MKFHWLSFYTAITSTATVAVANRDFVYIFSECSHAVCVCVFVYGHCYFAVVYWNVWLECRNGCGNDVKLSCLVTCYCHWYSHLFSQLQRCRPNFWKSPSSFQNVHLPSYFRPSSKNSFFPPGFPIFLISFLLAPQIQLPLTIVYVYKLYFRTYSTVMNSSFIQFAEILRFCRKCQFVW